jgi:molybdopterin synthase catalytic subunit
MPFIQIISDSMPPFSDYRNRKDSGAEIIFHGCVRKEEEGKEIIALDYEYYSGMAEKVLSDLADETVKKYNLNDLICIHRTGQVAVGEISVRVVVWSKHRIQGEDALEYFISKMKTDVPIWKWAITAEGDRFPTGNSFININGKNG